MPIQADSQAPYAASPAIIEVVEQYRHRGLKTPVTADALTQLGIKENVAPRTLQALKLLELLDPEGQPTQNFDDLRRAGEDDFQERFAEHLRYVYAEVFSIRDPVQDDVTKIRDAFRHYKPQTMQDRMVRLFYGLCEYAGLVEHAPAVANAPARGTRIAVRRAARTAGVVLREGSSSSRAHGGAPRRAVAAPTPPPPIQPPPPARPGALKHELIAGLLRELPEPGQAFPEDKQEAWFAIAKATFKLIYKTDPDKPKKPLAAVPDGQGGEAS